MSENKKKCIVTLKLDVTMCMPFGWEKMDNQEIIEWIGDTPEIIEECVDENGFFNEQDLEYLVKKVERI